MPGADERLARNLAKRIENVRIVDPATPQLPLDHRLALGGEVRRQSAHALQTHRCGIALLD
jgi:hypothetical protein